MKSDKERKPQESFLWFGSTEMRAKQALRYWCAIVIYLFLLLFLYFHYVCTSNIFQFKYATSTTAKFSIS